jgi:hypothetical protein
MTGSGSCTPIGLASHLAPDRYHRQQRRDITQQLSGNRANVIKGMAAGRAENHLVRRPYLPISPESLVECDHVTIT